MNARELRCYAVAAPGVAPLVADELKSRGIVGAVDAGGVAWSGDLRSVYEANLWLRTATRVIVRIAQFRATRFWELERRADAIDWATWVRPGTTVAFRVTAKKSKLYHSDAVAERLAASVVRAVRGVTTVDAPVEEGADEAGPAEGVQLFIVRLSHDELTLSIDSSGAPLYQRGYRQAVAKAPLRETLAAALVMVSGWQVGMPLIDPFCGSGTIPLEAALMAMRIAPGLACGDRQPRGFAFTSWPQHRVQEWLKCVDAAREVARPSQIARIVGSDRDAGAITAARANAARAGLEDVVQFEAAPVSAFPVPEGGAGWVVTNPPYGMRVGDGTDVRRLYAAFGRAVRERVPEWGIAMLSPDARLDGVAASEAGRRFEEKLRTRNGGIPVRVVSG